MRLAEYKLEPVGEDVFVVGDTGSCAIGVCIRDHFALVVDSGQLPRVAATIKKTVEQDLDCRVELLFNTHYHSDHTFGNQSFDCPIIASRSCRDMMQACLTSHWSRENIARAKEEDPELIEEWRDLAVTMPTSIFEDDLEYDFHGRNLVFRRFGGHSPDSSALYLPDDNILFTGDIIFSGRYPTLLAHDGDPERLIEVLEKLLLYDVDTFIPGHGPVCGKDAIRESIAYWRCLLPACREVRREGASHEDTAAELTDRCRLPEISFDEFRHRRNIVSVLHYLARNDTL